MESINFKFLKEFVLGPRNEYSEKSIVRICQSLLELDNTSDTTF